MIKQSFGKTDLMVTPLGFGAIWQVHCLMPEHLKDGKSDDMIKTLFDMKSAGAAPGKITLENL